MHNIETVYRPFSTESIFYVYVHRTKDTGRVFYVGKGKANRAWSTNSRNKHWKHTVDKHGFTVELIFTLLIEEVAFNLEQEIISQYGMDHLTNKTLGGVSTTGYRHSIEDRQKMSRIARSNLENNPQLLEACTKRIKALAATQGVEHRTKILQKACETVRNYTPEEKAIYSKLKMAWRDDPVKVEQHAQKMELFWNSSAGQEVKQKFSEATKEQWEQPEFRRHKSTLSKEQWNNLEFKAKMLEIRSVKIVVNRKLLLQSISEFSAIYNNGSSINNSLIRAIDQGYIGALIKGHLVERYSPDLHKDVSENAQIQPLLNFEFPRSVAIKADAKVYLRPIYLATELGANNPATTAEWLTKKAKANETAFNLQLSVASVEDTNTEIIRRIKELQNDLKN